MLGLLVPGGPARSAPPAFVPPVDVELPAVIPPELASWRYVSIPGVEVVALSSDDAIRTYAENIAQQRANLDAILPRDLRVS